MSQAYFIEILLVQFLGLFVFGFYENSNVVTLSPPTLSECLNSEPVALIQFYAPWCYHCQNMHPVYIALADELKTQNREIFVGAVDGTEHEEIAEKYSNEGFPTILLFRRDKNTEEYFGPPDFNQLYSFIMNLLEPSIHLLESEEEVDNFMSLHSIVVLGHFSEENAAVQTFYKASSARIRSFDPRIIAFAEIEDRDLANKFGFQYPPGLILMRFHEDVKKTYDFFSRGITESSITKWVIKNAFKAFSPLLPFHVQAYTEIDIPFLILFSKDFDGYRCLADLLASEGIPLFWVDTNKDPPYDITTNSFFNGFLERVTNAHTGLIEGVFVVMVEFSRFFINISPDSESVVRFVEKWRSGLLQNAFPIQELNEDSILAKGVQIVTTSTFESTVLLSQNDVFLLLYSPMCPHCQDLAPTWVQLSESAKDDNVLILQMDATTNEIPDDFNINGFPTMVYIQKSINERDMKAKIKHDLFEYNGSRKLKDLQEFIQNFVNHSQTKVIDNQENQKTQQSIEEKTDWVPISELETEYEDLIDAEVVDSSTDLKADHLKEEL